MPMTIPTAGQDAAQGVARPDAAGPSPYYKPRAFLASSGTVTVVAPTSLIS
jgi:hypothetical protein